MRKTCKTRKRGRLSGGDFSNENCSFSLENLVNNSCSVKKPCSKRWSCGWASNKTLAVALWSSVSAFFSSSLQQSSGMSVSAQQHFAKCEKLTMAVSFALPLQKCLLIVIPYAVKLYTSKRNMAISFFICGKIRTYYNALNEPCQNYPDFSHKTKFW